MNLKSASNKFKISLAFFFCFLFTTPQRGYAQKTGQVLIDSLQQALPAIKEDTGKITVMCLIAFRYYTIDPDKGLALAQQALTLATDIKWPIGIGLADSRISLNYMGKADYPSALSFGFKALKIFEEQHDQLHVVSVLGNIGIIYNLQKDYKEALVYELKAYGLAREYGYRDKQATNAGNIGNVYYGLQDYEHALQYDTTGLHLSEQLNDKGNMAKNLGNIGSVYLDEQKYSKALKYNRMALQIYSGLHDKYGQARVTGNIGIVYRNMLLDSSKDKSIESNGITRHATIDSATKYLKAGIDICEVIKYSDAEINFLHQLAVVYKNALKPEEALAYYQRYIGLKDSTYSIANTQAIKELERKQALDIKEKDIQLAKLAVAKKRNERGFFMGGIGVLVLVIFIVLNSNRVQKIANLAQKDANDQLSKEKTKSDGLMADLQETLAQKEMLMKEVHHRVKNNLEVISNLLQLQGDGLNDGQAKAAIAEGQGRVRSIGLIHQKLYQAADITSIELKGFLQELYGQVARVFMARGQQVEVVFDVPETVLDIDTAIPLGLIVNELLTNAFKYALSPARKGQLHVKLSRVEEYYVLVVRDNGPGLPTGQDLAAPTSLGMRLVALLSQQLAGRADYAYHDGSVFSVYFKESFERKKTA